MARKQVTKPIATPDSATFEAGHGFTEADWAAVSDNPPWTGEDAAQARPFAEAFPALAESARRSRGRPRQETPKKLISLRLDVEVIERFKDTGAGWQGRINAALRKAAGL